MKENTGIMKIFGENTFQESTMRERLPEKAFEKMKRVIENEEEMNSSIADIVAQAMKEWAIEKGATHYTHWFQPLTGVTAEKHDSFLSASDIQGKAILEFSGKELIRGEPDASSFPSGGLRSVFEARGYTAWDCTSPAFLKEDTGGIILCIPTAFCSYRGEALDQKTPLLRSIRAINKQALRILRLFGDSATKKVIPSVGVEQEYFLIDREKYLKRKDLVYTGRTLFGAMPPKGQEMDDHYFGVIQEQVGQYMKDVNEKLWKMGVPAKTQHNEAAPAQHELAPIYEEVNLAVDHNQMIMETLKKQAGHYGLICLLHEKPFLGVNGSGKHNNWSLISDTGVNLLSPGETPHENIQFLLVLACILKAVDIHGDLLRWSAADVGNDHRLGAAEAPPAIISVFLGEQLEDVIGQLCSTGEATHSKKGGTLQTGVTTLPSFEKDATDRNRTSPFAFTGNKFEFRMAGASDSISSVNVVLNTIVAQAFCEAADILEQAEDFKQAVHDMIKDLFRRHRRILFDGNGYSKEWQEEAKKRGLANCKSMVEAIPALVSEKSIQLFEHFEVFTREELWSRAEVQYETYAKTILIEAKTMLEMAGKQIIPTVIRYMTVLSKSIRSVRKAALNLKSEVTEELLRKTNKYLKEMYHAYQNLERAVEECERKEMGKEQALFCLQEVKPAMEALRNPADCLELIVDKKLWPFPSYGDLIFEI